ncbi:hypothetical protein [Cupriavidus oxalaticus]|jgi:hypothetical protein|uniref:Uncharacterized protein n=1 Tax=Cupriavidus oxalaticus TaxID=96344 RepID=A0A976G8H2_9BURK|nr:hypothetical protein [Cupriavidus oxalaticus]QRQ87426.1 hypothetical protein JTE91_30285 [Cupriavidus oxalaticus]QRQ94246.1 hypothetical protein JTE92_29970 [Cupriavidus oxalaticus]WQD82883.1 hypothetical protein U0036_17720 [Cupriavidus oxalaticus]SPC10804.1 conserved exported hypothetical protein [Cupriavidus oxalaticus]
MWSHSSTKRARFRRPLFAALAVLFVVAATVVVGPRTASWAGPFDLPKGDDPIIGDLGGVPVSVPVNYIHLVTEYDGDPSVFDPERRKWTPPVRTFASKINSLPLMVHLPDFAPRTPENEASYYRTQKSIAAPIEWLPIGISASTSLNLSDEKLESGNLYDQNKKIEGLSKFRNKRYDLKAETIYGLTEYRSEEIVHYPSGPATKKERLFFFTDSGKDVAFIECNANGEPFEESRRNVCTHRFSLYPAIKAEVSLQYDARTLSQWMEYQRKARELILSFRVQPSKGAGIPARQQK